MNTITIAEPVAPEIESDPDIITLTISEIDRQTAGHFSNGANCVICTALRNRGFNAHYVDPINAYLEDGWWKFDEFMGCDALSVNPFGKEKSFYGPEVVGKVIRLRKVKP